MPKRKGASTPDFALQATALDPWLVVIQSAEKLVLKSDATGFRTHQTRVADRHVAPMAELGELFLDNTEYSEVCAEFASSTREYFSQAIAPVTSISGSESWAHCRRAKLPPAHELELALSEAFRLRRSVRGFTNDGIGIADVATLMFYGSGISRRGTGTAVDGGLPFNMFFRHVPSPGGLYPNECLVVATNVSGLEKGIYRYAPFEHALQLIAPFDAELLNRAFGHLNSFKITLEALGCIVVVVGAPPKVTRKYGPRGVRFMLLEAGMAAFAVNLAATALGFGVLDYQSYFDRALLEACGLQQGAYRVMHSLLIGWPANQDTEEVKLEASV